MPAYKDKAKGTWYVSFYYENRIGKKEKKMKRGFKTRREALEWERIFLQQKTSDLNMTFEDFVPLYIADMKKHLADERTHYPHETGSLLWKAQDVRHLLQRCDDVAERNDGTPIRSRKSIFSGILENAS